MSKKEADWCLPYFFLEGAVQDSKQLQQLPPPSGFISGYGARALRSVFIFAQGSLRKEFPKSIGGSDICYFCKKRVYVMERLSAEGHFFHRECFKCDICSTTLRLGIYAFDVEEGNGGAV